MDLIALSYTSSAVRFPTPSDFRHLLSRARARNEREQVTGVLLYAEGTFHQYIEGPAAGVGSVYAAIERDPLHHEIFELIREPIARREFSLWSMGFPYEQHGSGDHANSQLLALLADEAGSLSPGRLLLNAFWTNGLERARRGLPR